MLSFVRIIIVALISLALPLQASLVYARAVGMATGNTTGMAAAIVKTAQREDARVGHASHAEHHQHHNSSLEAGKQVLQAAGHQASHPQPGNPCDSCAKCCLAGAAAPPLIWPQAADVVAARVLFSASSDTSSCFIPDGLERPPRCL